MNEIQERNVSCRLFRVVLVGWVVAAAACVTTRERLPVSLPLGRATHTFTIVLGAAGCPVSAVVAPNTLPGVTEQCQNTQSCVTVRRQDHPVIAFVRDHNSPAAGLEIHFDPFRGRTAVEGSALALDPNAVDGRYKFSIKSSACATVLDPEIIVIP